jgi:hypothetical protein
MGYTRSAVVPEEMQAACTFELKRLAEQPDRDSLVSIVSCSRELAGDCRIRLLGAKC